MGGQGKTHVTLEYCHRAKDQRFKPIFWLDAIPESSLRKGFRTIAERIKPPEMIIDDDSGLDLVLEKLREWPEPLLMILIIMKIRRCLIICGTICPGRIDAF